MPLQVPFEEQGTDEAFAYNVGVLLHQTHEDEPTEDCSVHEVSRGQTGNFNLLEPLLPPAQYECMPR